jgi:RNA polymerase sigma-70 factor, ECF subfamily
MHKDQFFNHEMLLRSLVKKDQEAFTYLYIHSRQRLFIIAYAIVQDIDAAQDIVQDFFTDFYQQAVFENIISLQGYMVYSVKNRAINLKKRQQRQAIARELLSKPSSIIAPAIENEELKQELTLAINNLPPMAAKVFTLHYIENMNYEEIAIELKISKHTVSNHMSRALKGLRNDLEKNS